MYASTFSKRTDGKILVSLLVSFAIRLTNKKAVTISINPTSIDIITIDTQYFLWCDGINTESSLKLVNNFCYN